MSCLPAHAGNYRAGRAQAIAYIVVHYTAGNGDTARGNCVYFQGAGRGASAHYFVDETSVWQSVPDGDTAWHCGAASYRHPLCRNANSLGVELCSRVEGGCYVIPEATQRRAAALVRALMTRYGIDEAHVLRHYDVTGKRCPEPFVREAAQWTRFLKLVKEEIDMTEAELKAKIRAIAREEIREILAGRGTSVSAALATELEEAVARGITDGKRPGGYATRAQVAAMIVRATQ